MTAKRRSMGLVSPGVRTGCSDELFGRAVFGGPFGGRSVSRSPVESCGVSREGPEGLRERPEASEV
ncbi:hypothetical protein GCM10010331_53100 [Streptomyces xanthochromogenes]|nr:hypothetical protein GCM10010331_53100 [Streptomyces xanthochromogenes]